MPWLNIRQNLPGTAKWYFSYKSELYVIVEPTAGGTWQIYKLDAARAGSSWAIDTLYLTVAPNDNYIITGAIENPSNEYMFVTNAASGEVYINPTGDFSSISNWISTPGPFAGYVDAEAQLGELVYYNRKVYLAHRGGVSTFNSEQNINQWEQVADFTTGFEGIGQCTGMHVLNGVLYVIVSFDTLYAIYQYDAAQPTLNWIKFAEYPRDLVSTTHAAKSRYITSRNNVIFTSDYGLNLNIFNSRGLDTTLTGQPRFTQGVHLNGVPSSMITYTENGFDYIFTTCWDTDFSGQVSSAYSENLITTFNVVDNSAQEPGETWFTGFSTFVDTNNTTALTLTDGALGFKNIPPVIDPTKLSSFRIDFHIKTNILSLLPGETYTITWEQAVQASATKTAGQGKINGSGATQIGFSNLAGNGIDVNSPNKSLPITGTLFGMMGSQYEKVSFTFNMNDIDFDTTDGSIYIQGAAAVKITVPNLLSGEYKVFTANAAYRNIKLYRGTTEDANTIYLNTEYIIKEYADIPPVENDNHAIEPPSPPDQWFIKFSQNSSLSSITQRLGRRLITNKLTLQPNENYKLHFMVKKGTNGIPTKTYRVRTISPVSGIPELSATCSGTEQRPFEWVFDTTGIAVDNLKNIQFEIEVWEEDILPGFGATFYISDINIQQQIAQIAENTIYRYDGQAWDDAQTKLSNDGNIIVQPFGLHKEFETNSDSTRLYCIANDDPYVWSTGPSDPFGGQVVPRIIMTWED
jgi:hypothetical protein